MRMLYQEDPILPFEMADKANNGDAMDEMGDSCDNDVNGVFNIFEEIQKQREEIFLVPQQELRKLKSIKLKVMIIGMLLEPLLRLV